MIWYHLSFVTVLAGLACAFNQQDNVNSISRRDDIDPPELDLFLDQAVTTGDKCYAWTGDCIDLNDKNAMARACGPYTVVGWDDAGCGKSDCHCGKPICCPVSSAPKNCIWRGDTTGGGMASDCNAQCMPGEVNIHGIVSSWGGGFVNDGGTDRCGRGCKAFCCPDPDFQKLTNGCYMSKCNEDCRPGTISKFGSYENCGTGGYVQNYCCPDTTLLQDCKWISGESEADCSDAACPGNSIEISRTPWGGLPGTPQLHTEDPNFNELPCQWSRNRVACCDTPTAAADTLVCDVDACDDAPEACNDDPDPDINDGGGGPGHLERDLQDRGNQDLIVRWPDGNNLAITRVTHPQPNDLWRGINVPNVIRSAFRLSRGACNESAITYNPIEFIANRPMGLEGIHTEHPVDRQLLARFIEDATQGQLRGQATDRLPPIPRDFFLVNWASTSDLLGQQPPIGGPNGPQPNTINDRLMHALGSTAYRDPLMPVQGGINTAKASVMQGNAPIRIARFRDMGRRVVADPRLARDALQMLRRGLSVFQYLNNPDATARFNMVRQQMRQQLQIVQNVNRIDNLVAWWDMWIEDRLDMIEANARQWARDALVAMITPTRDAITEAVRARRAPPQALLDFIQAARSLRITLQRDLRMPRLAQLPLPTIGAPPKRALESSDR